MPFFFSLSLSIYLAHSSPKLRVYDTTSTARLSEIKTEQFCEKFRVLEILASPSFELKSLFTEGWGGNHRAHSHPPMWRVFFCV